MCVCNEDIKEITHTKHAFKCKILFFINIDLVLYTPFALKCTFLSFLIIETASEHLTQTECQKRKPETICIFFFNIDCSLWANWKEIKH